MSDNEARLRVVIDTLNKSHGEIKSFEHDLKGANDQAKSAKGGFADLAGKFEELTGVGIPTALTLGTVGTAIGVVYGLVSDSVGRFSEYTEEVRGLSSAYSLTARQASMLIQTLDDARVSPQAVTTAFRTMADKGIQPTVENLAKLADEFNDIQDPIERSKFLAETFGSRAGPEMAKALALGGDALKAYGKAAVDAGLTLTAADLDAAERLKQAQDEVADAQLRLDNTVGPVASRLGAGLMSAVVMLVNMAADALIHEAVPAVTDLRDASIDTESAFSGMGTTAIGVLDAITIKAADPVAELQAQQDAAAKLKREYSELSTLIGGQFGKENDRHEQSLTDLNKKAAELKGKIDALTQSNGKYYEYTQNSTMSANELALAQYELADAQAQLAQTTDPEKQLRLNVQIEDLQTKVSGATTVVRGYIDNSKDIGELSGEYDEVTAAIQRENQAHRENTLSMVFNLLMQQEQMNGYKNFTIGELGTIAQSWGLIDEDTAAALGSMESALADHAHDPKAYADQISQDLDKSGGSMKAAASGVYTTLEEAKTNVASLSGQIDQHAHDSGSTAKTETDGIVTNYQDAVAQSGTLSGLISQYSHGASSDVSSTTAVMNADIARSMGLASSLVSQLEQEINGKQYHNYIITHLVTSNDGGYIAPGAPTLIHGGHSAGGSFVVPGNGQGDRPFTVLLEPGELVTVTPRERVSSGGAETPQPISTAQGGGGANLTFNIYQQPGESASALADRIGSLVTRKARADAKARG